MAFCGSSECKKGKRGSASQSQSSETLALDVNGTEDISVHLRARMAYAGAILHLSDGAQRVGFSQW